MMGSSEPPHILPPDPKFAAPQKIPFPERPIIPKLDICSSNLYFCYFIHIYLYMAATVVHFEMHIHFYVICTYSSTTYSFMLVIMFFRFSHINTCGFNSLTVNHSINMPQSLHSPVRDIYMFPINAVT